MELELVEIEPWYVAMVMAELRRASEPGCCSSVFNVLVPTDLLVNLLASLWLRVFCCDLQSRSVAMAAIRYGSVWLPIVWLNPLWFFRHIIGALPALPPKS